MLDFPFNVHIRSFLQECPQPHKPSVALFGINMSGRLGTSRRGLFL